jgi:hypothetical protein
LRRKASGSSYLSTCQTAASGMFSMLADTTMAGAYMATVSACFAKSSRHLSIRGVGIAKGWRRKFGVVPKFFQIEGCASRVPSRV